MVPSPTKIKTVYSFFVATIMVDPNTPMGNAIVEQAHPYACQQLRQGDPEFNRLYSQVERENTPHVLGTAMATSPEAAADSFNHWLKSKGIDIKATDRKGKFAIFSGDAQNPQTGLSFTFHVLMYFDFEK